VPLWPRERAPSIHWLGGWVGPRTGLDTVVKRKIYFLYWEYKKEKGENKSEEVIKNRKKERKTT